MNRLNAPSPAYLFSVFDLFRIPKVSLHKNIQLGQIMPESRTQTIDFIFQTSKTREARKQIFGTQGRPKYDATE